MKKHHRAAVLVLVSCTPHSGMGTQPVPTAVVSAPSPTKPVAPASSATSEPASARPSRITLGRGRYSSTNCDARGYERVVRILSEDELAIDDLVSPCPPGKKCIWSGIVERSATYRVVAPESLGKPYILELELGEPSDERAQSPPPHLEWYESRGVLTEPGDACPYRRVRSDP